MQTQFRKAAMPAEVRSLMIFDHKVFRRPDWFLRQDWLNRESWWMIIDRQKVGCCAFALHVDFDGDLRRYGEDPLPGSLYIVSTGILPKCRGKGYGALLKSWQISYARHHRFTRIVTNTRQSNAAMIGLNQKFGFKILRSTAGYYHDPFEATVVMELRLDQANRK